MATFECVTDCLLPFVEIHNQEMTEATWKTYHQALKRIPDELLKDAAQSVLESCRFFPKPADFVQACAASPEKRAGLAWVEVLEAMNEFGTYRTVEFSDPVVHAAIRKCGGWTVLCAMGEGDLSSYVMPKFVAAYVTYVAMGPHAPAHHLAPCLGLHDQINRSKGLSLAEPVKCKLGYTDRGLKKLEG